MAIINLRDFYPFYTSDCFMEVSDEVAEMFKEFDRKEADCRLCTYRHKAYYSLDRDDGLEHEAVHKPARISLTLIKYECMVYIEPFYGGYYVWRLTAKSKQAVCYVFIEQKVGCASQLDGETIPSAYRWLVPSNRGDVYPNSICKCNARLWVACLREYLAELSIPNLVGRFPVQDLHGGVVDLVHDGLQVLVCQAVETGFLGQVAADASVAVLVRAALV